MAMEQTRSHISGTCNLQVSHETDVGIKLSRKEWKLTRERSHMSGSCKCLHDGGPARGRPTDGGIELS